MQAINAVSVSATALLSALASAEPQYLALIPNGYNVKNGVAIGHKWGASGGPKTNFGAAFALTHQWTVELCRNDSDGDGQTNGQELGDPCCEWKNDGDPVRYSTGLSNPGDASSMANPSLWAAISCSSAGSGSGAASNGSDVGSLRRNATSAPSSSPTTTPQPSAAASHKESKASLAAALLGALLTLTLHTFLTP